MHKFHNQSQKSIHTLLQSHSYSQKTQLLFITWLSSRQKKEPFCSIHKRTKCIFSKSGICLIILDHKSSLQQRMMSLRVINKWCHDLLQRNKLNKCSLKFGNDVVDIRFKYFHSHITKTSFCLIPTLFREPTKYNQQFQFILSHYSS